MGRIVVVDEDPHIRQSLRHLLETEGFEVEFFSDGKTALEVLKVHPPSAVFLELRLADLSGIDVCRELKQRYPTVPVLVLSSKTDVTEKVLLLELGADDYLTKPFDGKELIARLRACLRHSAQAKRSSEFMFDDVAVNFLNSTITRAGKPVTLTARQFRLLELLVANEGRVLSRENLVNHLGRQEFGVGRALDNQICRLRRKLENDPKHPAHLRTVPKIGYKFIR